MAYIEDVFYFNILIFWEVWGHQNFCPGVLNFSYMTYIENIRKYN